MLRNEYLVAENHILRDPIKGRIQLSDAERQTLAEIGKKLGKQALEEVANIVKPDTMASNTSGNGLLAPCPMSAPLNSRRITLVSHKMISPQEIVEVVNLLPRYNASFVARQNA